MAAAAGPRYAPEDPTLPKPWRGLIDGNTGYLYFWNPETNITQYERPVPKQPPGPVPPPKATSMAHQGSRVGGSQPQNYTNASVNDGRGAPYAYGSQNSRSSAKVNGPSDYGSGLSAESYRRQHEITVNGDNIPAPFIVFETTGFPSEILREVHNAGFSSPTPIQAQSWPIALQSRDIVAIAKTGSGKTLGYLLPGFLHLNRLRNNSRMGPTVLVLSPTRELATQILDETVKFGKSSRISCTCLYGGAPKGPQLRDLDRGVDVVVATPGRLNDILEMRRISLHQVSYLVLDEADRMLDMGFEPQIRKIVKEIPPRRQTLMFTATWPKEVRKIAADLLVNPVQVNIGNIDELVANKSITQYVEIVMPLEKQRRLEQILRSQDPGSKIIIFCSTKRMCDQLARSLTRQFGAAAIHGDKSQSERDHVLGQFRTGRSPVLVATDVAARGLDIKDIRVVINYDFPTGIEDYVHRIGRTGRAGATGVAYTFFSDQDSKHASDLVKVLEGASQRVPPEIREIGSRGGYGKFRRWGSGSGGRDSGRSHGGGHGSGFGGRGGGSDSGYGGRGGGGDSGYGGRGGRSDHGFGGRGGGRGPLPSSGRSEGSFRGRSDRDRYDRSCNDSHEDDARGRHESRSVWSNNAHGTGDKHFRRSRSCSRSYSPNRNNRRVRNTRSRSRSRSRSRNQGQSRSRSHSRSPKRFGNGAPTRSSFPDLKREPSPDNTKILETSLPRSNYHQQHSAAPAHNQQEQQSLCNGNSPGEMGEYDHSPSTRNGRSWSPYKPEANGWMGQASISKEQSGVDEGYSKGPIASSFPLNYGEEEEEGMIPADEEGAIHG